MTLSVSSPLSTIDYPETDGLPMAESDFQRKPLTYAVDALDLYFQTRADVYVSGNLFIYYEEGNPAAVVAPDVFVVIGTTKRDRSSYFLWQEPKGPDFVLEITSKHTRGEDQEKKPQTYAALGVREYFQYDPTGDYLDPPLQGLRLVNETYQSVPVTVSASGELVAQSDVLGLELHVAHGVLRFYDPATGQKFLAYQEVVQAYQEAETRAGQAAIARQAAEQAQQAAEQARQAAEQARQAAEVRLAELEARLQALQAARTSEPPLPEEPQP